MAAVSDILFLEIIRWFMAMFRRSTPLCRAENRWLEVFEGLMRAELYRKYMSIFSQQSLSVESSVKQRGNFLNIGRVSKSSEKLFREKLCLINFYPAQVRGLGYFPPPDNVLNDHTCIFYIAHNNDPSVH